MSVYGVYETFCTGKGICHCTKKAEEHANHGTNVRLTDMQKRGKNDAAVARHHSINESLVLYMEEESTEFLTLRLFKQDKDLRKC